MDLEQIKALSELMIAHDLTEIAVRDGEQRVILRRRMTGAAPAPPVASAPAVGAAANAARSAPPGGAAADGMVIKSPMVGTFYAAADPKSSPFVSVGSRVDPDTVVCIIEAMKVFNEIKAEVGGVIERVLVGNGQPVEFGQPLFQVAAR